MLTGNAAPDLRKGHFGVISAIFPISSRTFGGAPAYSPPRRETALTDSGRDSRLTAALVVTRYQRDINWAGAALLLLAPFLT